jgi:phospholipase C
MRLKAVTSRSFHAMRKGCLTLCSLQLALGGSVTASQQPAEDTPTKTPIKHVIVIIGENRTFDHVFARTSPKPGRRSITYCPRA